MRLGRSSTRGLGGPPLPARPGGMARLAHSPQHLEAVIVVRSDVVHLGRDTDALHVAQLAGIPKPVIHRAEEILAELERKGDERARRKAMRDIQAPTVMQMTLFSAEQHPLIEELQRLAIDELTPIEAISKLYELQKRARES